MHILMVRRENGRVPQDVAPEAHVVVDDPTPHAADLVAAAVTIIVEASAVLDRL